MSQIIDVPIFEINRENYIDMYQNVYMSIGQRIREARKRIGMSQAALASKVGIKQPTLSALETGDSEGTTYLASFAAALGVNALWLETGKGEIAPTAPESTPPFFGARPVIATSEAGPGVYRIRKLDQVQLRAGITGYSIEELQQEDGNAYTIDRSWADRRGFFPEDLVAAVVIGDSMEPTISDGDIVVINTADRKPADGVVFAVNHHGEPVIKRARRDNGRGWLLASDNPDQEEYPPRACRGDDCLFVGRVVQVHKETI